jgi:transcriptional regulator with XRE-family HTH domain
MVDPPSNRLAEIRKSAGKSRRDLAVLLDVTEDTIRRFEENRGGPIPSRYIPTLATELGADPSRLMGWDREPASSKAAV